MWACGRVIPLPLHCYSWISSCQWQIKVSIGTISKRWKPWLLSAPALLGISNNRDYKLMSSILSVSFTNFSLILCAIIPCRKFWMETVQKSYCNLPMSTRKHLQFSAYKVHYFPNQELIKHTASLLCPHDYPPLLFAAHRKCLGPGTMLTAVCILPNPPKSGEGFYRWKIGARALGDMASRTKKQINSTWWLSSPLEWFHITNLVLCAGGHLCQDR